MFVRRLTIVFLLTALTSQGVAHAQRCSRHQAGALAADARRATQWNWGWGSLFAASAIAHTGLALSTDNKDRQVALWTGVAKSTIAVMYQAVYPIRVQSPENDCFGLDTQLARAAEVERKREGWIARVGSVALNVSAFAYVAYQTDDYVLAASGALAGLAIGELTLYTAPKRVLAERRGTSMALMPQWSADSLGMSLGGTF